VGVRTTCCSDLRDALEDAEARELADEKMLCEEVLTIVEAGDCGELLPSDSGEGTTLVLE